LKNVGRAPGAVNGATVPRPLALHVDGGRPALERLPALQELGSGDGAAGGDDQRVGACRRRCGGEVAAISDVCDLVEIDLGQVVLDRLRLRLRRHHIVAMGSIMRRSCALRLAKLRVSGGLSGKRSRAPMIYRDSRTSSCENWYSAVSREPGICGMTSLMRNSARAFSPAISCSASDAS
jgi:hypothetical protein